MNLKPETSQCDPYFQLPAQVTSVKERIGLQHFTHRTRERVMNLIKSDAPQFENQGLLHKYYFLDDIHPPVKKKGKPANKGERLNAKEKKKLFCINKQSQLKYATFEKINTLWNDYLKTVMKGSIKDAELRLAKCDYHGAKFAVLAAINPSLVGIVGFVVQETKNTFKMINKHDKIMIIPKDGTVFSFAFEDQIYKLYGSSLKLGSHQRSKIKFKSKKVGQTI